MLPDARAHQILEKFDADAAPRPLAGAWATLAGLLATGLAVFALWWTQYSLPTQVYRANFLLLVLVLTFLLYPSRLRERGRVPPCARPSRASPS